MLCHSYHARFLIIQKKRRIEEKEGGNEGTEHIQAQRCTFTLKESHTKAHALVQTLKPSYTDSLTQLQAFTGP